MVNRDLFMPDNVHPNHLGYERMIELWRPYLEGKMPQASPLPSKASEIIAATSPNAAHSNSMVSETLSGTEKIVKLI